MPYKIYKNKRKAVYTHFPIFVILPPMKKYVPYFITLFFGGILTLAFAPFHHGLLAVFSMMALAYVQEEKPMAQRALLGFTFGLGFFSTSVYWVFISIHTYGESPLWMATILTFLFVSILSGFLALQGALFAYLFPKKTAYSRLLGFPATWVFVEWLRSWLFTGFPWVLLGYSQTQGPLQGWAPLVGVYGVSFLLCCMASLLLYGLQEPSYRFRTLMMVFLILLLGKGFHTISWTTPTEHPISMALVQGNASQSTKWSEEELENLKILYQTMTLPLLSHGNLVVWPESAITAPPWAEASYFHELTTRAKEQHSTLIATAPMSDPGTPNTYYNGLTALGEGHGSYLKRHLVPFGEYVPFHQWLRPLTKFFDLPMSDLSSGKKQQPLIQVGPLQVSAFICYEIAYGPLFYLSTAPAQLLLTLSDDTWFGHSIAPYQHLQIAQWRAIEAEKPLAFVSNSGATALINAKGQITQQLPLFIKSSLQGSLQPMKGITPIVFYGQGPIMGVIFLLLGLPLLTKWFAKRRLSGILRGSLPSN